MSFYQELKRRNVFKVALAYVVAAWLVLQITDVLMSVLGLPESAGKFVFLLLVIGFIPVLVFSWAYEVTPEGIKRESEVDRSEAITHETAARLNRVTIVLLVAVAAMVLVDRFVPERREKGSEPFSQQASENIDAQHEENRGLTPTPPVGQVPPPADDGLVSVAVLPFVNMSDDAQNEYFSDGISEELLNVLVKIENLRVPSRTSSFSFKDTGKKLSEIGRELNVDHVLEGSVRKAGNQIRVTAQLIDVHTDTHLWSETYTRELDDIFAVQDEISQAIVQALQVTLTGEDQQALSDHGTDNVEAYNLYLLGRHVWNRRTPDALQEAVIPLKKAVALDPDFEQAWTAMADAYVLSPEYGVGPIDQFVPLANEAIRRALDINPASARALTARGYVKSMFEYDVPGALEDFERAIELEPSYATAHQWYGEILAVDRRLEDALAQIDRAIELDPLAPVIRHVKGWLLAGGTRYEEALDAFMDVFKVDPGYSHTHFNLALLYCYMGRFDLARQESMITAELYDYDNTPTLALIDALANPDDRALHERAVRLLESAGPPYFDGVDAKGNLFMLLGEHELALDSLERAFAAGDPYAIHMNRQDAAFGAIRDHPRFQALLRKMNLLEGG